jgi:hypothetical protein
MILPDATYLQIDQDQLARELMQAIGYADRLGYATTISPIRVKDEQGNYFTGGYQFRAFTVPTIESETYSRLLGIGDFDREPDLAPVPDLDDPEFLPEPEEVSENGSEQG